MITNVTTNLISNFGVTQHLPDVSAAVCGEDKSLHFLDFWFLDGVKYKIEVLYQNVIHGNNRNIDANHPCYQQGVDADGVSLLIHSRVGGATPAALLPQGAVANNEP